ncbi:cytochrome c oxidase assembly factor 6 homolog isoform X1 [Penaeus japonicus]|uniref:cytochrome c oxidase assembly factor 6 homolog isoform X1 n=1 Tax=Penaeus japonicus TaxID=27405 RepID=UPI001C71056E|nr:cytochrome c oxidase assembly factor 6 homolog isoform X1 [Penaeus japonicus]XP_042889328.1 cytochrome c oxidase assembly factor 6 homolog isoform X1 [Penaeus japonicus]XP_042889329.1 cytochrome c oxidase assembly factor 6 homolog isoform X1 [Penaeus japonicus]
MSFRDKGVRKACWESRDRYWACLDLPDVHRDNCLDLRRLYEHSCPSHWVKHFDRKRQYMEFKERIHTVGLLEAATMSPCPALEASLARRHRVYSQVVFT